MTGRRMLKACPRCGGKKPAVGDCPRCGPTPTKERNSSAEYRRNAATVRANATVCHLCGLPFTDPDDPPVADHITPRSMGGDDGLANLAAAHRSCNGSKGQLLGERAW